MKNDMEESCYHNDRHEAIVKDWGTKEEREVYSKEIDEWLAQFDEEERLLEYELLKHFQMYRGSYLKFKIDILKDKFYNEISWAKDIDIFYGLKTIPGIVRNSDYFYFNFKMRMSFEVFRIEDYVQEIYLVANNKIVFVDDYSGSGDNFKYTIDYLISKEPNFKNFEIVFMVVNISELSLTNIQSYAETNSLNIKIIYVDISKKAFTSGYIFSEEEYASKRVEYYNQCIKFNVDSSAFGYKITEALIAFDLCVPNNNLAMFRETNDKYKALFARKRPKKSILHKNLSNKEKIYDEEHKYNYLSYLSDFKTILFAIYCHIKGTELDISKGCEVFGMSPNQFNKKINECILNSFIKKGNNCYQMERGFYRVIKDKYLNLKEIVNSIISKEIEVNDQEYCGIINYTPLDFEKRFKGYKK